MGFWRPIAAHLSTSMAFNDNAIFCVKNDGLRSKLTQFPGRLPQVLASWCACCACMGKVGNRKPTRKWLIQTVDYWVHHIVWDANRWHFFLADALRPILRWAFISAARQVFALPRWFYQFCLSSTYLNTWSKYPQSFTVCTWRTIILPQVSEGERICMDLYELPSQELIDRKN